MNCRIPLIAGLVAIAGLSAASGVPASSNPSRIADFHMEGELREQANHGASADIRHAGCTPKGLLLNRGYEYRPGAGYRATFHVPELDPKGFSFSLDFAPIEWDLRNAQRPPAIIQLLRNIRETIMPSSGPEDSCNLITLGEGYRWLGFSHGGGHLQVTLNNQDQTFDLTNTVIQPRSWHRLACAFDHGTRTIQIVLDGRALTPIVFPSNVTLRVLGEPETAVKEKEFTFANYSNGEAFHGYVSSLRVFDRPLTSEELVQLGTIHREPLVAPTTFGWGIPILFLSAILAAIGWWGYRRGRRSVRVT